MNQLEKRKLADFSAATFTAGAATIVFEAVRGDLQLHDIVHALGVALPVAAGVQFARPYLDRRFRRAPFRTALLGKSLAFAAILAAGLLLGILAERIVIWDEPEINQSLGTITLTTVGSLYKIALFSFGVTTLYTFLIELDKRLGPGVLLSWMMGRYHSPRREERVFMFVDLKGSTTHAEQLGDLRFSAFLRDFFSDITGPVIESMGEVSHYIGDEAVISWPIGKGIDDANCVRCFYRIVDELARRKKWYLGQYEIVPEVKAGVHCGTVVLTEVGDIKTDLVFHGDTPNTASRIQALCRPLASDLLLSKRLLVQMQLPPDFESTDLGPHHLRGKERDVHVCAVRRSGDPSPLPPPAEDLPVRQPAP